MQAGAEADRAATGRYRRETRKSEAGEIHAERRAWALPQIETRLCRRGRPERKFQEAEIAVIGTSVASKFATNRYAARLVKCQEL